MKQKCTHSVHVPKTDTEAVEVVPVDEAVASPKKRSGVGKALASVKQMVSGAKEAGSSSKDGARPIFPSEPPVNRAEVVIAVRPKRPLPERAPSPPPTDTSSVLAKSIMGPPPSSSASIRSFAPSTLSLESSGSRKRARDNEYEVLRLRSDFNASQEELALVKRQYAKFREETESYIESLHQALDGPSAEEHRSKGKGRAE
jgi:hypothetical protein